MEPARASETSKSINGLSPVSHALATAREGVDRDDNTVELTPIHWLSEKRGARETEGERESLLRHFCGEVGEPQLSQMSLSLGHLNQSPQMHRKNGQADEAQPATTSSMRRIEGSGEYSQSDEASHNPLTSVLQAKSKNVYQSAESASLSTRSISSLSASCSFLLPVTPRNTDTLAAPIESARPHERAVLRNFNQGSMSNSSPSPRGAGYDSGSGAMLRPFAPFPGKRGSGGDGGGEAHQNKQDPSRLCSSQEREGAEERQEGDRLYRSDASSFSKFALICYAHVACAYTYLHTCKCTPDSSRKILKDEERWRVLKRQRARTRASGGLLRFVQRKGGGREREFIKTTLMQLQRKRFQKHTRTFATEPEK